MQFCAATIVRRHALACGLRARLRKLCHDYRAYDPMDYSEELLISIGVVDTDYHDSPANFNVSDLDNVHLREELELIDYLLDRHGYS